MKRDKKTGFETELQDGKLTLTGLDDPKARNLTLPEEVQSIGHTVFQDNCYIEEADLSQVETVEYGAFECCRFLKAVTLGSRLKYIGSGAFSECPNLREVKIPAGKNLQICASAFTGTPLESADFGRRRDFSMIEDNTLLIAAGRCPVCREKAKLVREGMECSHCRTVYSWKDLDAYRHLQNDGHTATAYINNDPRCTIPAGIKRIASHAFDDCYLCEVSMTDEVEEIGCSAFHWCEMLTYVNISEKVRRLEHQLFCGAPIYGGFLKYQDFDYIGRTCFYGNGHIEEVRVFYMTRIVGMMAFANCCALKELTLDQAEFLDMKKTQFEKKGVRMLGEAAFSGTALQSLQIPGTVRILKEGCFEECRYLEEVTIKEGLLKIEADVFHNCVSLRCVELPESILSIGEGAFLGCVSLKSVRIPASLRYASLEGVFEKDTELVYAD